MNAAPVKYGMLAAGLLSAASVALAQAPSKSAAPIPTNAQTNAQPAPGASEAPEIPPAPPQGGSSLLLRGLDKITGRPTNITAPIGKQVQFATLTITARFCYSTPASETPETAAFVQVEDHRPDQAARKVFSGWMYASSPGLNGVEHPLYDVWVISCNNTVPTVTASASTAPVKVQAPDSSDKQQVEKLPEGASQ